MRPHQHLVCITNNLSQRLTKQSPHIDTQCKRELPIKHIYIIIMLCVSQTCSVLCGSVLTIHCPVLLVQCRVVHRIVVLDFHLSVYYHIC